MLGAFILVCKSLAKRMPTCPFLSLKLHLWAPQSLGICELICFELLSSWTGSFREVTVSYSQVRQGGFGHVGDSRVRTGGRKLDPPLGVPLWHSGLKIQRCHCNSLGCHCDASPSSSPGTCTCHRLGQKPKPKLNPLRIKRKGKGPAGGVPEDVALGLSEDDSARAGRG